jgi:hypothetical protein
MLPIDERHAFERSAGLKDFAIALVADGRLIQAEHHVQAEGVPALLPVEHAHPPVGHLELVAAARAALIVEHSEHDAVLHEMPAVRHSGRLMIRVGLRGSVLRSCRARHQARHCEDEEQSADSHSLLDSKQQKTCLVPRSWFRGAEFRVQDRNLRNLVPVVILPLDLILYSGDHRVAPFDLAIPFELASGAVAIASGMKTKATARVRFAPYRDAGVRRGAPLPVALFGVLGGISVELRLAALRAEVIGLVVTDDVFSITSPSTEFPTGVTRPWPDYYSSRLASEHSLVTGERANIL